MPVFKDNARNTFYVKCYYEDYTGAKKQKLKRGFKLQREAKEWERTFLKKQQGTPDMPFQALYEIYIEDLSHRVRPRTIYTRKNIFENKILPYFKDRAINSITPADIRAWQNEQIKAGHSDAYLNNIHVVLSSFFNYAVNYYNLPSNPCRRAGSMGKATKSVKFWTLEEYRKVISHVDDYSAKIAIETLFYSGMRRGELLALTLKDLDFENNQIEITESKTINGVRTITMPPAVMADIKAYTKKIYKIKPDDSVFHFTETLIRNHLRKARTEAGVKHIRIHDLRHSHVSLLIELGFSPHLIAERIGDTVQMVNNIYGHLYPTKHQEVADKLNKLVSF